jgi:hypothetical protein
MPCFFVCLAPDGVYIALLVTKQAVSSYLTFSPLPIPWRLFSVALSLKSPSPVVNRHPVLWSSDFPQGLTLAIAQQTAVIIIAIKAKMSRAARKKVSCICDNIMLKYL